MGPGDWQHTSGLARGHSAETATTRSAAVAAILAVPLAKPPGTGFSYANDNYQLAVAIVELASGVDYQTFARKELFARAGLKDTGFAAAATTPTVAPVQGTLPARLRAAHWGGQGGYSTTRNLFTWYRALRRGKVLDPRSVRELFAASVPIREGAAGLGWFTGATSAGVRRAFTRGNDDFGPNGLIYAYPDTDTVIVVLAHTGPEPAPSHSRAAHASIERLLFKPN